MALMQRKIYLKRRERQRERRSLYYRENSVNEEMKK